jgi:hypothetical protein
MDLESRVSAPTARLKVQSDAHAYDLNGQVGRTGTRQTERSCVSASGRCSFSPKSKERSHGEQAIARWRGLCEE